MTLWLYLHFPSLQLDTLFADAKQSNSAICIIEQYKVKQANSVALEQGITIGTGLASAASLCAQLQVFPYQEKIESDRLQQIAQWLYLHTSDISLCSNQGLLLKVTNMLTLYHDLNNYWTVISTHLDTLKIHYHFATAYSPLAAKLLAESGINQICDQKKQIEHYVLKQPISVTQLSPSNQEKLARIGIQTLGQLVSLNMTELARRFDIQVVNYVGRLLGQFKHPVTFYHPPAHFDQYLTLLFEIERTDWLLKPLLHLLKQLECFLKLRDQVAYEIALTLHQRNGSKEAIHFHSAVGDYSLEKWQKLCQLTLESITLSAPIVALNLKVIRMGETPATKSDLFDKRTGEISPPELLSLLQAKLGKQTIHGIQASTDPRPERSTQHVEPFSEVKSTMSAPSLFRPSFIYLKPEPLNCQVSIVHGPERIQSGWWDGDSINRDYFVAREENGRWLWIYRTPAKQWFIQGLFS